ncbi:MAG: SDR family oxidoreductase [Cyclobacteriaceae bacterium]|nr:SDR family oxidoreductase [Cyclobacteriaceae bacterium]
MKILITGANGLLGQKLAKLYAIKPQYEVLATGRGECRYPINGNHIHYASMDITKNEEVDTTIASFNPDVIIHTAAMTNVDECETDKEGCWLMNVTAVEYLLHAAEKCNSFFLHVSTDFIFDGVKGPLTEDEIPNPVNYYGESKLESEKLVMKSSTKWAIARTVLVYGITHNMSRSNIILWVKNSLEKGDNIRVVNDQWRTPTLAEDLAMGCFLVAAKKAEGVYNISGKDFLTPYEMAMMTANYFNLDKSLIEKTDGSQFQQVAKRPSKTGFIIDKAKALLGYEPHSFEEGISILAKQIN